MTPDISMVSSLSEIAFLNNQTILNNMKSELPQYIAKAAETSPEVDVMSWWVEHAAELPHWSATAKMVALIQPSSGAVERVFAILTIILSIIGYFLSSAQKHNRQNFEHNRPGPSRDVLPA